MIKEFVVHDEFIHYSGPMELSELYLLLDYFWKNHHYDKKEKRHYEKKTEDEWYIELELEPFKTISEYIKMQINLLIFIRDIKNIEIEVKGKKRTIQQADISIRFRSFILKDYEEVWERWPFWFFIRSLVDKFFYTTHINRFSDELISDTKLLQNQIKSFLNLYQRR